VAITTDVIVGFPGETDAEFEESYEFCRQVAFAAVHVFPYSNREGTLAARLPSHVPDRIKKERVHRMIRLADRMAGDYRSRFIGDIASVLWESQREDGRWEGLTDTYIRVRARSSADLTNRLAPVHLSELSADGINGEVIA
jgi:threonylcarbamoyladenosine tRNA methylthiotransferase MtaB